MSRLSVHLPRRLTSIRRSRTPRTPQNAHAHATVTAYPGSQDTPVPPVMHSSHHSPVCKITVSPQTSLKHAVSPSNTISNNTFFSLTIIITPFALLYDNPRLFCTLSTVHTFILLCTTSRRSRGLHSSLVHYLILVHLNYTILIHFFFFFLLSLQGSSPAFNQYRYHCLLVATRPAIGMTWERQ